MPLDFCRYKIWFERNETFVNLLFQVFRSFGEAYTAIRIAVLEIFRNHSTIDNDDPLIVPSSDDFQVDRKCKSDRMGIIRRARRTSQPIHGPER